MVLSTSRPSSRSSGPRLELHHQTVARRTPAARHGVEGADRSAGDVPRRLIWHRRPVAAAVRRIRSPRATLRGVGGLTGGAASAGSAHSSAACRLLQPRPRPPARFANSEPGHALVAASWQRQPLLPAGAMIDERAQQRKVVREILEHALEIALEPHGARPRLAVARIAPRGELARDDLLDRLAIGEIRAAARAGADEIVLAERQAGREVRRFDQAGDARTALAGVSPSQSQPRLMTLPNVLMAMPC